MKYSGIGGQAVMEGVMMRNGERYAVAVRLTDGSIHVDKKETKPQTGKGYKIPIVRGVLNFIDSLVIGMSTLMDSASYFEEEPKETLTEEQKEKKAKKEKLEMTGTLVVSVLMALVIFMLIPYYFSRLVGLVVKSQAWMAFIEGIFRIAIFIAYVLLISLMEDIKRVFMYHGAEHKCINCIEHGLELNVENVRKSSKQHKRCGTSFLLFVLIISVFVFMFIRFDSSILQLACRLLLIPVIAGISYEFIRWAGRSENKVIQTISKPGLWLQNLTTREPDDDMIEVGIASVEAVFDWRKFQEENRESFHEL
ncbi:MAG: DUF1385 domain-containing protein [Lachnospiraceae bacterium]|nr:DUF1385 domain-containing protein [Lachnospiraceae bacterium]MDY4793387.1 DUF1385 domain-containing protein [Pararoseburia sp.]